jgi:hypothetical protein
LILLLSPSIESRRHFRGLRARVPFSRSETKEFGL